MNAKISFRITLIFVLSIVTMLGCGHAKREGKGLDQMDWLLGTWERLDLKPDQNGFEIWSDESPTKFSGKGVTLRGQDTLFVESLGLVLRDKKLYYVAEVSHNEAPVEFEITQSSDSGFVCENPDHDFPMKISYSLSGNRLSVVISGDGKSASFHFLKSQE